MYIVDFSRLIFNPKPTADLSNTVIHLCPNFLHLPQRRGGLERSSYTKDDTQMAYLALPYPALLIEHSYIKQISKGIGNSPASDVFYFENSQQALH